MFERLGSLTYRFRFAIVAAWVAMAAGAVLLAPSLAAEGMTDQSAFLPADAVAVKAHDALERAFPGATSVSSATLAFSRATGLTDQDREWIDANAAWLTSAEAPQVVRDAVTGIVTATSRPELASMLRSDDGRLELVTVNLDVVSAGSGAQAVVEAIREHLDSPGAPDGLVANVTGTAAISSDYLAAIVRGTDSTTLVTVVLVIVILLLIYRAPLAAMVPLVTIGAAFLVARGTLGVLAAMGWRLSSLLDTFIVVLVFGVGTDYAIFLISRFREEVSRSDWHGASMATVRRIGAVITASAATVIVGLGSMAFADFGMIQTTGPALAVAIFVTLVAGLTLTPALLSIFGHYLFWPLHARAGHEDEPSGFFARLATAVSHRPGIVTAVLLVVLLVPAMAMGGMRTNFDVLAELPADSDARTGFEAVADHLGKGKIAQATGAIEAGPGVDLLDPASLARLRDVGQALVATEGVASLTSLVSPAGDGVVPEGFMPSRQLALMADGFSDTTPGRAPDGDGTAGAGATSDSASLLDDEVMDGLDDASDYLGLLGVAFPDVAAGTGFRSATATLDTAREQVQAARDAAVVSTQLRTLARAMTSPASAAGGGDDGSTTIMGDYLDELAAAFPAVEELDAYATATAAAARLEREASIGTALELSNAFASLATWFEDTRPDATMVPDSLAGTADAKARAAQVKATFARLPDELDALAAVFAGRADDVFVPAGLTGSAGDQVADAVAAFVSDDRSATRFYLTTEDDPYSQEAFGAIRRAQAVLAEAAPGFGTSAGAWLGGPTAELADVQTVLGRDFERVAVVTVIGILAVLIVLLRALVAPLYLVGTVLLSCATALGLSSWFFQTVLGQAGVSFYLPLMVFVLLVALGSDYNIFLMSRVREESEGRPIRDGIRIASGRTGAVITSAGLILAGTFGSMATAPLVVLFQVGVAVALGVLIDTFIVRSILVPAITMLFGDRAWWPFGARGAAVGRRWWPVVVTVPETGGFATAAVTRSRRRLAVALVLLTLVPVAIAGLAVWSLSNPAANLDRVTAAVVNQDEGATVTRPDGTVDRLTLGSDLAAGLVATPGAETFTWVEVADAADARSGLTDGRYGAVLTIPSDFSRVIATVRTVAAGGGTSAPAEQARLELATNDAASYLMGPIARSISDTIAMSAAEQVTSDYVDDVLLSVTTARDRVAGSVADANGIASESTDLVSGASGVSGVAGELVAGLEEMASRTSDASEGFDKLAAGIDQLALGTRQIATGAAKLADGTQAAADGSDQLAAGAQQLAAGLHTLDSGTGTQSGVEDLPGQAALLAQAAQGVSDGMDGTVAGLDMLANQVLGPLDEQTAGTLGSLAATVDGLAAKSSGSSGSTAQAAGALAAAAKVLDGNAGSLGASVRAYADRVAALSSECATLGGTAELCDQLAAIAADGGPLSDEAASVAAGAGSLLATAGSVAELAADAGVAAGTVAGYTPPLAQLANAAEQGITGATSLADGLDAGLTRPVSPGYPSVRDLAHSLRDGTAELAAGMPLLADGVSDAATGADELAGGMTTFAKRMAQLATGADALASGAALTADGAVRIAGGTSQAAAGASQLSGSVGDVVDAGRLVQAQADGLAEDGRSVADEAERLASSLEGEAASIPSWSAADRQTLGGVVADPVTLESTQLNALPTAGSGLAPYFMSIALWVGALATYLVLPAFLVPRGRRRVWWAPALLGFLAGAVIGIAQAVVMVAALRWGVGIEIARLPELLALAVLVAVTAAAVTQALVALFGTRGWFVALVLVVLQLTAAGAWFPIETAPAFFGVVHPLLPMSHALDAFRALVAGGGAPLWPAVLAHLAWTAAALAVTLGVAAWRDRREVHGTGEALPAAI